MPRQAPKRENAKHIHDRPKFGDVLKRGYGILRNYKGGTIQMHWNLSEEAKRDQIFLLKAPCRCGCGESVNLYIDYQEFMHYARAI